jgi:hypothetical protein
MEPKKLIEQKSETTRLLQDQPQPSSLTPRPEPLDARQDILTRTPAARSMKIQVAILSIICGVLAYGLVRVERRLSFTERRVIELSAREPTPARFSSTSQPSQSASESSATDGQTNQSDGPELRLPVKPLTPEATTQRQKSGRKTQALHPATTTK